MALADTAVLNNYIHAHCNDVCMRMQSFLSLKTKILSRGKIKMLLCSNSFLESFVTDLKYWKKNTFTWTMWMLPRVCSHVCSLRCWARLEETWIPGGLLLSLHCLLCTLFRTKRGAWGAALGLRDKDFGKEEKPSGKKMRNHKAGSTWLLSGRFVHEPGQTALSAATKGAVNGPDIEHGECRHLLT